MRLNIAMKEEALLCPRAVEMCSTVWRASSIGMAVTTRMVGEALKHTSASHVFLYTAPIFAALGLHRKLPFEWLSAVQWGGIAVAAGGIAFAFLTPQDDRVAVSLGTMLWAMG